MSKPKPFSLFDIDFVKPSLDEATTHTWKEPEPKEFIECYTDGGCHNHGKHEGIGAWAWYIKHDLNNASYRACKGETNTTNNVMELKALYELLSFLIQRYDPSIIPIKVYIDSGYVVFTINQARYVNWMYNGWKNSEGAEVKNIELWKNVIELYSKFEKIELIHIRGHQGIYGNEVCDKLCGAEIKRQISRRKK